MSSVPEEAQECERVKYDYDDELRGGYGNVNNSNTSKLVWWILAGVSAIGLAEAGWLGSSVINLQTQVARLETKVDFLLQGGYARAVRP